MRFSFIIIISIVITLLSGCSEKPIFSKKIELDGIWSYSEQLSFPIEVDQLNLTYDLILSLTYAKDFNYQNIYVKIKTQYPSGKQSEDVLSLNLTDGSGLFLGNCNLSSCEIDLLLQGKFKFKEKGKYVITIIQNGREDNLEHVNAAELKLYTIKNSAH